MRTQSIRDQCAAMPTLHSGHFDNLKRETATTRVWCSRMTVADGMPCDNQLTYERLINGAWITYLTIGV